MVRMQRQRGQRPSEVVNSARARVCRGRAPTLRLDSRGYREAAGEARARKFARPLNRRRRERTAKGASGDIWGDRAGPPDVAEAALADEGGRGEAGLEVSRALACTRQRRCLEAPNSWPGAQKSAKY